MDRAGEFHRVPRIDDMRLASLFGREVLANLVRRELLSPEWADRLLSWRHTGFNVHSRVRAKTMREADSHIPDKGRVAVRYYGLYANAHRGKVKKASLGPFALRIAEDELRPIPSQGWAEMIRKVYEVDPMVCPLLYFLTMVEGDNKAKIRPHPAELKNQITIITWPSPGLHRCVISRSWSLRIRAARLRSKPVMRRPPR